MRSFLRDEIWWSNIECQICGSVDEDIPWAQAKTPRRAMELAQLRHEPCIQKQKVKMASADKLQQIAAAEVEVERVDALLVQAKEDLIEAEAADKADKLYGRRLAIAQHQVVRYTPGPEHARTRLAEIKIANKE